VNSSNPQRLLPSRQLIKRELESGKLGEPGLIRIHHWEGTNDDVPAAGELPSALLQQIDVILWLMGNSPITVYAVEHLDAAKSKPGRYLQIHFGFPGDAMALLVYSSLHPPGDSYRMLHVIGSAGAAYADDQQIMQLLYQGGQVRGVVAQEFMTSVPGCASIPQDWANILAVADAVHRSLASRQAVSLEGH
jgi:predicted dehydrogenase